MNAALSRKAWTAVIPVKAWVTAKTRLMVAEADRVEFAHAVALDTLDTVAASGLVKRIVVVTSEAQLLDYVSGVPSAVVLRERRCSLSDPLNDAIKLGRAWAVRHAPTFPIVVVPADLPALTTSDLDMTASMLGRFARSHIPDRHGDGTTLAAAARPNLLVPLYGPSSERAHSASGSIAIRDVPFSTRVDVDDLEDLAHAAALGMGPRTRSFGRALGTGGGRR